MSAPTTSPTADTVTTGHADQVRRALAAVLPEGALVTAAESVERYSHDEAEWAP